MGNFYEPVLDLYGMLVRESSSDNKQKECVKMQICIYHISKILKQCK